MNTTTRLATVLAALALLAPHQPAHAAPGRTLPERINICVTPDARDGGHSALPCVWFAPLHYGSDQSTLVRRSGRVQLIGERRARHLFLSAVRRGALP